MRPLACLPDRAGAAVLHAALDAPEAAGAAWRHARTLVDRSPDARFSELHRLLPLVHRNLADVEIDDEDRADLRARYDRTLAANTERVRLAARWLTLLDLGGVTATVLKGIPLALRDYRDLGVRPMGDTDLLVPAAQTDRALALLEGAGWHDMGDASREALARLYHGSGLVHPTDGSLDLHWQMAGFVTTDFAPRLEELEVGTWRAATLDRTDTLAHVCLHGVWTGSSATTRWVADAVTVARAADAAHEALDGDRILAIGRDHGVGALLGTALAHIEREHAAPIPPGLAAALTAQPVSRRVRHRQRVVTAPPDHRERLVGLAHLRAYWTYTRWGWTDRHAFAMFPAFLTELWGLESAAQLPAALITRPLKRLRRRG